MPCIRSAPPGALRELPVELDRVAAIRAGMDPDLATVTTKQIQRELAAAEVTIARAGPHRPSCSYVVAGARAAH